MTTTSPGRPDQDQQAGPDPRRWRAFAVCLVAGIGSGVVISPNITLALSQVPVERAGSAGAVLQTGQRLGAAVGIAAVGSLLFSQLASSGGDWGHAASVALRLCVVVVVLSLVVAVVDLRTDARARSAVDTATEA